MRYVLSLKMIFPEMRRQDKNGHFFTSGLNPDEAGFFIVTQEGVY